jgi:hypothetical protein
MEPKISLLLWRKPITGLYLEPIELGSHITVIHCYFTFNIGISSAVDYLKIGLLESRFPSIICIHVTNRLVLVKYTYRTHIRNILQKILLQYIKLVVRPGFVKQLTSALPILCRDGSLVTWKVISLTDTKCKLLIFSVSALTLSYAPNTLILMIFYGFCLPHEQFCYVIVHIYIYT